MSSSTYEKRPWGEFEVLLDAPNVKVKRITINAGEQISLQRHQRRSEYWTCVSGRLEVFRCSVLHIMSEQKNPNCKTIVDPGQTAFIRKGVVHRAKAIGDQDAVFIEIQLGDYFGEDDIERFLDDYGRK